MSKQKDGKVNKSEAIREVLVQAPNASAKEDKDAEETTADALQQEATAVMQQVGKDAAKRGKP